MKPLGGQGSGREDAVKTIKARKSFPRVNDDEVSLCDVGEKQKRSSVSVLLVLINSSTKNAALFLYCVLYYRRRIVDSKAVGKRVCHLGRLGEGSF